MNRRYFLRTLGMTGASILLAEKFLLRAERYFEHHGDPLLKAFRGSTVNEFYVSEEGTLFLGDPYQQPTIPTWREWLQDHCGYSSREVSQQVLQEEYGDFCRLDETMCSDVYLNGYWERSESPNAQAYTYLESLDIGPELVDEDGEVVGGLEFMDGPSIGNDCLLVQIDDRFSLSCLQWRLEQLGCPANFKFLDF